MFTTTTFSAWDLNEDLQAGLESMGWEFVTQVQKETIPIALSGRDVIGQARTGSGKTAAFGLPTMNACQPTGELQALILAPTRELANQVAEELSNIQGETGLNIQMKSAQVCRTHGSPYVLLHWNVCSIALCPLDRVFLL